MRIAVINGSPKGHNSITLQYVNALQKVFPEHTFTFHHVAAEIRRIEKEKTISVMGEDMAASDFVLWAFPVYYTLVPGQLKRFVELVEENDITPYFSGKPSCALSTSVRFFDHSAHEYIHEISERWDMHVFDGYSCQMDDLLNAQKRQKFFDYFHAIFRLAQRRMWPRRRNERQTPLSLRSLKLPVPTPISGPERKVVIVSTPQSENSSLGQMISYFKQCFPFPVQHWELTPQVLKSGCLGCLKCVVDNVCAIHDECSGNLRRDLLDADALVWATPIRDGFLDARFKMFMDRRFMEGHCPVTEGKILGWILSGPLRQLPNTRFLLQSFSDMLGMRMFGPITDEDPSEETARLLTLLADVIVQGSWPQPSPTFFQVAGRKLFRDFVWSNSAIFSADHRFYKEHDFYDFPQKDLSKRLQNLGLHMAFSLPFVRKVTWPNIVRIMVAPYRKVVEKL